MPSEDALVVDQRFLDSGEEAGTAPDDRRFRPDVEGLRALAVLLVVLFHAGVPHLTGGYVGVDVFFVISGFVITGLLLRERQGTGRTSILDFYARRCRRILPAATLVMLCAVVSAYAVLGVVTGNTIADDGRWAAAFLSNFHFAASGTNYLLASRPPSPLQNYWSLSVEEQFYVVYPTLFLLVAGVRSGLSLRVRMTAVLSVIIVASYWLSIASTATTPISAYFSPFTRAWELALGALVAVGTSWLKGFPRHIAAALTWAGLGAIAYSACTFTSLTAYPGSLVAVPVVGAASILVGGAAVPRSGVEALLGLRPFQWLGRRSYSLYLWHWPILIIAAERVQKTSLPLGENLLLLLVAMAASMVTYALVENPIRHWRLPSRRTVLIGMTLVVTTVIALSLVIAIQTQQPTGANNPPVTPAANEQVVLRQVAAATRITSVSKSMSPTQAANDSVFAAHYLGVHCQSFVERTITKICKGTRKTKGLMVVYGDSHAQMWVSALTLIARKSDLTLVVLSKEYCPAEPVTVINPPGWQQIDGPYANCDKWHTWAEHWINTHRPKVLIVSQEDGGFYYQPSLHGLPAQHFSGQQWQQGLVALLDAIKVPNIEKVVLGNIPVMPQNIPDCLSAHPHDVQACAAPAADVVSGYIGVEKAAVQEAGGRYIDTTPWFCSSTCTPIVGRYIVYMDSQHVTETYARYLWLVLDRSLGLA